MEARRHERDVIELMKSFGWRIRESPRTHHADFIAELEPHRYAAEVKYAKEPRRTLLEGLLASAILRARAAAAVTEAKPLAIVCAPSISAASLQQLEDFVQRFGDGCAWGVMDDSGLVVFHGPGLEPIRRPRGHVRKPSAAAKRSDFLSDLGQWMLKVLLSRELPPEFRSQHGRADEPIANGMMLARVAGVSVASAARFVASLREDRFLAEAAVLGLVRVDDLLEQWRAVLSRRQPEVRARWLFPSRDPSKQLDELLRKHQQKPGERACLGLFAACDRLGFRFVSGVAPHLYLEKAPAEVLRRLGLRIAEPGESADVLVREPRFPESVFRGSLERDGVPVADVLQCWLDVRDHPARGEEMAAHLSERVIRPFLLERGR